MNEHLSEAGDLAPGADFGAGGHPLDAPWPEPRDPAELGYDGMLFARGWLLCRPEHRANVPDGWVREDFGAWVVWRDPRLEWEVGIARGLIPRLGERASVACLGVMLDADRPEDPPRAVLERLARLLAGSEDAFLAALDTLAGRFVLLYRARGATGAVGDASGTRQAFRYLRETPLMGSHAALVAQNAAQAPRGREIPHKFGYPGLDSPWENVHLLTPNTRVRVEGMRVRRFWPRGRLPRRDPDAVAPECARLMRNTLTHLAGRFDLYLSITAGLDSRVALALANEAGLRMRLFTYWRSDKEASDALDRQFRERYMADTGRHIELLSLRDEQPVPRAFKEVLARSNVQPHVPTVTHAFLRRMPTDGSAIHVRSNISGTVRQFYKEPHFFAPRPTHHALTRNYIKHMGKRRRELTHEDQVDIDERFGRYARITGLLRCEHMMDLRSLYYWEFRASSWYGNAVAESDVALDTVAPYNCRRMLDLMVSVSERDRLDSLVHKRIVEAADPQLAGYDVNQRTWTEPRRWRGRARRAGARG